MFYSLPEEDNKRTTRTFRKRKYEFQVLPGLTFLNHFNINVQNIWQLKNWLLCYKALRGRESTAPTHF
jgi:hypothetical protein